MAYAAGWLDLSLTEMENTLGETGFKRKIRGSVLDVMPNRYTSGAVK